ncbi:tyrosine-type recombinase/integrase [Methylobacterium sp. NMS14P]|uniref:tyrosine-type recombinase/integrase n=1 Tax=Methylobacterium sp. NMS14P TaxID=2894310 RepID=UPI0023582D4B|nr:tyrosine-type recombinase/integrase [Methylobacterium sp. NMS14P]WCS27191.1 tyrosine-type recombinase/integrase [Methylobacterium sp. NMS14P]
MGTIIERRRANGSTGYSARIVVQRAGVVHRETQTFDRRAAATAWIKRRERELSEPGALDRKKADDPTLGEAIDRYIRESRKAIGRTKAQVLNAIKAFPIAERPCSEVTNAEIAAFMQELSEGRTPATVGNYVSHLSAVMNTARDLWGWPISPTAMKEAQRGARSLGVIAKSRSRERVPTLPELDRLMAHFGDVLRRRSNSLPMQRIVAFALFSTRRQEEILRIAWADLDEAHSKVLVRDMKHPGQKVGNDQWCELPPEALAIALAMPRISDRIFPFNTDAVSTSFTRACAFLGIEDLHFHDMRHAGVSRLFEMGRTLPQAAAVSGHRSWQSLQRYTHISQKGDRMASWPWLKVVTEPEP